MDQTQLDVLEINNIEAARALRDVHFLGCFSVPTSPSAVAKHFKVAANVVHHHAKRCKELGLLFEAKRERGQVFYQLAAKAFKVPNRLMPDAEHIGHMLAKLSEAFAQAHERSERIHGVFEHEFGWHTFDDPAQFGPAESTTVQDAPLEPRPAHFQSRSLALSAASYRTLLGKMAALINEIEADQTGDAAVCTVALLGFDGALPDIVSTDPRTESLLLSSFLPVSGKGV